MTFGAGGKYQSAAAATAFAEEIASVEPAIARTSEKLAVLIGHNLIFEVLPHWASLAKAKFQRGQRPALFCSGEREPRRDSLNDQTSLCMVAGTEKEDEEGRVTSLQEHYKSRWN
jgi:hypothetical protein